MENTLEISPKTPQRSEASKAIVKAIIDEYKPESAKDVKLALQDLFAPMFEALLQGEMDEFLGYPSNERGTKKNENRRNGYTHKTLKTSIGDVKIKSPRDRDADFSPKIIPKRSRDISEIEDKVLSMYAKGMSQRDISDVIKDIYGFEISSETV